MSKTIVVSIGTSLAHNVVDPDGDVVVADGADQEITLTPGYGYEVDDVLVDGASVGAVESYEFINVVADHTLVAMFKPIMPTGVTVTALSGSSLRVAWNSTI